MTNSDESLTLFESFKIRRHYDAARETWYFSVIDVVAALINQPDYQVARKYWNKLSERLKNEGSQVVTKCHRLKMLAADGKSRFTDAADVETLLRLIQSVPSPKAEPIKLWLAKTGYERLQEIADPERALNRAREYWRKLGRSEKWIQQRMLNQETRNKLTDYWGGHDIKQGEEFAILTNIIHKEWSDLSIKEHKDLKSLKDQNLRDHMGEAELIFSTLAEFSTRQIAESVNATGMDENKIVGKQGGSVAKNARVELEEKTGKQVVTGRNFLKAEPEAESDTEKKRLE